MSFGHVKTSLARRCFALLWGLTIAARVWILAAHVPCDCAAVSPASERSALAACDAAPDASRLAHGVRPCLLCQASAESWTASATAGVGGRFASLSTEVRLPALPLVAPRERDLDSSAPRAPPIV